MRERIAFNSQWNKEIFTTYMTLFQNSIRKCTILITKQWLINDKY
jgi:hypothetical protein